ncbi:group II intron maturase-specific domain-containing protein [Frankia sp. Cj5]|uniref:group II intron maturase-specific domain-containing protein n=1 Tax=Frankia sp. Cj5 TaxID=2880978 RepID=UPI001EF5E3FB|nr:group II intron maturase-specific domain-containing protein [Frankia sp. Cj5]
MGSPLLANLLLHYGFDAWMAREFPTVPFERFSDEIVVHCVSESAARRVRDAIAGRLAEIGLELSPEKTRIAYCKDSRRRQDYPVVSFTFCGYTFRPRKAYDRRSRKAFTGFLPGVSEGKLTDMSRRVRSWRLPRRTTRTLDDLARGINPVVGGWLPYSTRFYPTLVVPLCRRIDRHLMRWARAKYARLRSDKRAREWLKRVRKRDPGLFAHWQLAYTS